MVILQIFTWWYHPGWSLFVQKIRTSLISIASFFSMSSLIRTLFQPFRQISATSSTTDSSLGLKFQMFIDRLISRLVGFTTRLILLLTGLVLLVIGGTIGLALIILWPIIPLAPFAGLVLTIQGVTL